MQVLLAWKLSSSASFTEELQSSMFAPLASVTRSTSTHQLGKQRKTFALTDMTTSTYASNICRSIDWYPTYTRPHAQDGQQRAVSD